MDTVELNPENLNPFWLSLSPVSFPPTRFSLSPADHAVAAPQLSASSAVHLLLLLARSPVVPAAVPRVQAGGRRRRLD